MSWTAIVPIKSPRDRKSRLSARLSPEQRVQLSDAMLRHVLGVLQCTPQITEIAVLSPTRPHDWHGLWLEDRNRGLNAELQAAVVVCAQNVIVIHADLPALAADDLIALIAASESGVAIAPDRYSKGTNALVIRDVATFRFDFGIDSFARHCDSAGARGTVVRRNGLALDVDVPQDLNVAIAQGVIDGTGDERVLAFFAATAGLM